MSQQLIDNYEISRDSLRWGVEKRFEFIEFRLYWEGKINRSDIQNFFGISTAQASNDLKQYQEHAPGNVEYNKSEKFYFPSPIFTPKFIASDSNSFFNELFSIHLRLLDSQDSYISNIPDFDILPTPTRFIEPTTAFRVISCLRNKSSIEIEYQSMTTPEPTKRLISPHALSFDGFRWHIRSYCHLRKEFRDFLFSRIISISNAETPVSIDPSDDLAWNTKIQIKIGPNPNKSQAQRKAIKLEYNMTNGEAIITVRVAMLKYLLRRLNLLYKFESGSEINEHQHIILLNREEIKQYL